MFLLEDVVFHDVLYSTQIRSPGIVVGAYLCFVRPEPTDKFVRPRRASEAVHMMREGQPAIEQYWATHPLSVEKYKYVPGLIKKTFDNYTPNQLKSFTDRLYNACETIEDRYILINDTLGLKIRNNFSSPPDESELLDHFELKTWKEGLAKLP